MRALLDEHRGFRLFLLFGMSLSFLLFPLIKRNLGLDLADSGYSLGNYLYPETLQDMWYGSTYLANLTGSLLTGLPGGSDLVGMRTWCGLLQGLLGVASLFFCSEALKLNPFLSWLGVLMALGLCWCPSVILYNTLTGVFFTLMCMLLYLGLRNENRLLLFAAGLILGLNIWVRLPNVLEAAFILCVFFTAFQHRKETPLFGGFLRRALPCILGCAAAYCAMLLVFIFDRGLPAYQNMLQGILRTGEQAEGYSLADMALAVLGAFGDEAYYLKYLLPLWAAGALLLFFAKPLQRAASLPGGAFRVLFCALSAGLFVFLGARGLFPSTWEGGGAFYNAAVLFILAALFLSLFVVLSETGEEKRLFALMILLSILILPFGGNNHIYSVIGCLFLIAPWTLDTIFGRINDSGEKLQRLNAALLPPFRILAGLLSAILFVRAMGTGYYYVFGDTPRGTLEARLEVSPVTGVVTTPEKKQLIEELSVTITEVGAEELLLYGDTPGLSYYLSRPCAISTSWANLGSYPAERFGEELEGLKAEGRRPLVIVSPCEEENTEKEEALESFLALGYEEYRPGDYPLGLRVFAPAEALD